MVLKTAFKPRWILSLVGALLVATGFVLLSQWQFNRSATEAPPPVTTTEKPVPLTSHLKPTEVLMANQADQMVTATGRFLDGKQILVNNRLEDGRLGYWVVAAFKVDGAPDGNTIPVVRGWQPDETTPAPAPSGELTLTGRLLPTEAPVSRDPGKASFDSLSVAELINVWDVPSYSGFLVAGPVTGADGADHSAAASGLDQVTVGPQPQERQINWLNVFYGIEWVVFAGFAVFLWYRLVADDYRREQEDIADAAAIAAGLDPAAVYRDEVLLEAAHAESFQGAQPAAPTGQPGPTDPSNDISQNKDQK
ncbi:SURF1 family protein [Paeniglutamicibacter kerguelensis]|uniref:SURF1-like protein n=1 Tax=Paeniglutamicibacter kerguelensis TaxID=254788 RepID=A0ABS4XEC8_9MICC|nr:SURF1 family protein [Paeniglutamicibacter kerguelensis]MBP2386815.1 cytochrome oxidase assembly protein ShyY1 [Paeniglutamicibacter kerguelensis]